MLALNLDFLFLLCGEACMHEATKVYCQC